MNKFRYASLAAFILPILTHGNEYPRFPNGLLTPSFGIVSEDDLAYDAKDWGVVPYDVTDLVNGPYWQCFAPAQATVTYRTWDLYETEGRHEVNCTVEFRVRRGNGLQIFTDRRGQPVYACKEVVSMWRQLTRGQKTVCLNGSGSMPHQDDEEGHYQLWNWEKFKTKRGCYSYFAGQCRTKGCAKRKCSRSPG